MKYFVYLSNSDSFKFTCKSTGNIYRMYKKLPYLVKNDEDIVEFENHPNFQEVEKDSDPVQDPTSSGNDRPKIYTKEELQSMNRSKLVQILCDLNVTTIPRLLQNKVNLVLELQGGNMAEETTETTETSEENDEGSSDESDKEE